MDMRHVIISEFHFFFNLPGSCQMEGIVDLYNYITGYLAGILCFVSALLAFVIFHHTDGWRHLKQFVVETKEDFIYWMRFVRGWTHSTSLELIWTIIPTCILIAIAIPSFILLYALDEIVDCQCVVKIVGYQWYWKYEYPINFSDEYDVLNVSVLSYMTPLEDLTSTMPSRLLEVDMPLVLPHSVNVKLIITSKDVLHSFAVPALGIKMDAVPGRLNQVTVFIIQPGIYYGQCSELCGVNHAYMPIVIHAVSFDAFEQFLLKIAFAQEKENILKSLQLAFLESEKITDSSSQIWSDEEAKKLVQEVVKNIFISIGADVTNFDAEFEAEFSSGFVEKPECVECQIISNLKNDCVSCKSIGDYIKFRTNVPIEELDDETFANYVMEWLSLNPLEDWDNTLEEGDNPLEEWDE